MSHHDETDAPRGHDTRMISGPPEGPVEIPEALIPLLMGKPHECVWRNEVGGLTFRVADDSLTFYVKWSPVTSGIDLGAEVQRLSWASDFTPVPEVLDVGDDIEGSWIVTRGFNAANAVTPHWRQHPKAATSAIGRGLRALHDTLDVWSCPFEWSLQSRLADVERRVSDGVLDNHEFSDHFVGLTIEAAMGELRVMPEQDLVVCHGDACAPNTLLSEAGEWIAHVDFDRLGVGDRWADLAIASWSTVWNYGLGWESNVYDAYGIEPDVDKIRYYRLLWELE